MTKEIKERFNEKELENIESGKTIRELINKTRWNMIPETCFFEDNQGGNISDWYGNFDELNPEIAVLTRFVEKVRQFHFFLENYNQDILQGDGVETKEEFIWCMMKVLDMECSKIALNEIPFGGKDENGSRQNNS